MSENKPSYQDLENTIRELKSESKLQQSEQRFNLLLKASEDMITIHKPNGEYTYYNGPTCYAIKSEDVVGKMPHDLFDSKVSDQLLKAFEQVEKTGKSETLEVLLDWLGEKKWFSEYIYPVKNNRGEIVELVKVCRDIHQRKLAEQEIENQNKKLNELNSSLNRAQELAGVGSWVYYPQNKKSEWSDEMFRIWGFDAKMGAPGIEEIHKRVNPEDFSLFRNSLDKTLESGIPFDIEYRICPKNSEEKVVRSICKPILGDNNEVLSLTGATQDITTQKQFEKAQIEHQRLKAIGEMSSSISHDFNNSLQQMMGNLENIRNQKGISESILDRLNSIGSIIDNVAERVKGLQQFGDTKQDTSNTKLINFNTLIEESLSESRPLWKDSMERKGLRINIITDFQEIPKIRCNRGELKSAIHNMIKNSIEAMPDGGDIVIKTGVKAQNIFVTFTDTGIGMDAETRSKVFNPFFSTKGYKLGRGLGMSGVYNSLKKYRGNITVQSSKPSEGTTFEIIFPISENNETESTQKQGMNVRNSLDVLWVDDDILITTTVMELLGFTKHNCKAVNNGKDALEYLDKNTCDIVFTDIGMPEMNGWELVSAVKQKFGSKIKVVLVSGWSVEEKDKEAHGVDYVLQKPFTFDALKKIFQDI